MNNRNRPVRKLIGIYDADGGLRGEFAYAVGHILGRLRCGLCDITHSPLRRKSAWDTMVGELGVPFDLLHRNEQPDDVNATAAGRLPAVLAQLDGGKLVSVLGPQEIDELTGDVEAFRMQLLARLEELSLSLPAGT